MILEKMKRSEIIRNTKSNPRAKRECTMLVATYTSYKLKPAGV
jgi:hypothetical protein